MNKTSDEQWQDENFVQNETNIDFATHTCSRGRWSYDVTRPGWSIPIKQFPRQAELLKQFNKKHNRNLKNE